MQSGSATFGREHLVQHDAFTIKETLFLCDLPVHSIDILRLRHRSRYMREILGNTPGRRSACKCEFERPTSNQGYSPVRLHLEVSNRQYSWAVESVSGRVVL